MSDLTSRDISRLTKAMAEVQTESFFKALKDLLRAKLHFDTLLILQFTRGNPPQLVSGWLRRPIIPQDALTAYIDGAYRLDPFYQFSQTSTEGALYRLSDIAPDRFFTGEYYVQYYGETHLCDEVGLLVPLGSGTTAHLSMSRREEAGPFKRKELQCLRHYSPLLIHLLKHHCAGHQGQYTQNHPSAAAPFSDVIQAELAETLGIKLTHREAQIAELVIQGHSNASAALKLGIAYETVKVHRRNIYRKLCISSQGELFALLKDLL
ncbi:helix-turn-helix domain-containing protein [Lentibacter sp.]|mgnify:CR=1 FL=1|uniref:helix-turn-helix domain-containing protein n=1 Tax=Lentibacter sp. TaxID=2024994 RepID=UPI003F6A50EB